MNRAKHKDGHTRRVALLLEDSAGYAGSVLRAIAEMRPLHWDTTWMPPTDGAVPALTHWAPHAVITHAAERPIAEALLALDCPVVTISSDLPDLPLTVVETDHTGIADLALQHLRDRGFSFFAFYGNALAGYSAARENAFSHAVHREGGALRTYSRESVALRPTPAPARPPSDTLTEWLRKLPPATAILAANDYAARELVHACTCLGLRVPRDIAVLGVDNDPVQCALCQPHLSSVQPDFRQIAGTTLDVVQSQLAGHGPGAEKRFVPPLRVVVRESTNTFASRDPIMLAAMLYIRKHATGSPHVDDIAAEAGISRRSLERRFRKRFDTTVLEQIHKVRITTAEQLLTDSDLPLDRVAQRSGFKTASRLCTAFSRRHGCSPTEYRKRSRSAQHSPWT